MYKNHILILKDHQFTKIGLEVRGVDALVGVNIELRLTLAVVLGGVVADLDCGVDDERD